MRVVALREGFGIDQLVLEERPDPTCKTSEVCVRLRAASLNFRDLLMVNGKYDPKLSRPLIPCSDGAGDVVALGADVTRVKVGDRVCPIFAPGWLDGPPTRSTPRMALGGPRDGTLAEYIVLDQESVVRFPEHLSYVEAATLPCAGVTAWRALMSDGALAPGSSVLVLGTGGVSTFAVMFAKTAGARVYLTSRNPEKLARAKTLGVDELIDISIDPQFGKKIRALTQDIGVDHVIEIGGAGTLAESLRAVSANGTVSLIGTASGTDTTPSLMPVVMRNLRLQGVFVGPRSSFEAMNRAISFHGLRPVVDRAFPISEARAAFQYLTSAQHFGKVCIEI